MSKLNFSIRLSDNNSTISQNIAQALLKDVQTYFNNISNRIKKTIPDIVIQNIMAQPEYAALMNGTLQYELGITNAAGRLSEILDTIRSGAMVSIKPAKVVSNKISAGIKLQMIKKDFSDLISLGSASFSTEKGSQIDWLKWLLLEGDSIIISDYIFVLGSSPYSRTGMGIMKQSNAGAWRVPPEYAGTNNNNWITRGLDSSIQEIDQFMNNLIKE